MILPQLAEFSEVSGVLSPEELGHMLLVASPERGSVPGKKWKDTEAIRVFFGDFVDCH